MKVHLIKYGHIPMFHLAPYESDRKLEGALKCCVCSFRSGRYTGGPFCRLYYVK